MSRDVQPIVASVGLKNSGLVDVTCSIEEHTPVKVGQNQRWVVRPFAQQLNRKLSETQSMDRSTHGI